MTIAAMWTGAVTFLRENPIARFLVWFFLIIIGWNMLKGHLKEAGAAGERAAIKDKQAKVKEAVQTRSTEIIQTERDLSDAALEARDRSIPAPSFDQLSDAEKRVLDRRFRSGEAS